MTKLISKLKYQFNDLIFNLSILPVWDTLKYYWYSYVLREKYIDVRLKPEKLSAILFRIRCRNGVDRHVLHYVFFQNYHITNSIHLDKEKPVILDLGTNIGCTVVDFKLRYPCATVFGYEMDSENYGLAVKNCSIFSDVHLFNKAVWIKNGTISYSKSNVTDAYSIQSKQDIKNTEVECTSINSIISQNHITTIDFLKMDIEGAEVNIFNEPDLSWLNSVLSLNIEFHNITEKELDSYVQLISQKGFRVWKSEKHWNAIEGIKA